MNRYLYSAWFKDSDLLSNDQDHEWVACFVVKAASSETAKLWGDHLSQGMCRRNLNQEFLWSEVREPTDRNYANIDCETLPVVDYGVVANDRQIGW